MSHKSSKKKKMEILFFLAEISPKVLETVPLLCIIIKKAKEARDNVHI